MCKQFYNSLRPDLVGVIRAKIINSYNVLFYSLVVFNVVYYVEILADLLGHLECSVQWVAYCHHSKVCHMHYLESHLRSGCHNCVGAVRAVADDDVLAACLLEVEVVLNLTWAVARAFTLACAVWHFHCLLAVAYALFSTVVLLYEVLHSFEVSSASAYEDTYLGSVQIPELTCNEDSSRALCNRVTELAGFSGE